MDLLKKIFGTRNERLLKKMRPIVARINELEPKMQELSDDDLRKLTPEFRKRLLEGETLDAILPEAFAAVRERRASAPLACGTSTSSSLEASPFTGA